jgi:hypothetical protein
VWGGGGGRYLGMGRERCRVGNFRQKNHSAEDGIDGLIGLFQRNSSSAGEKNAQNSMPWNKNRSKLSEFHSEAFRGTENSRNSFPNRFTGEKNVGILFREKFRSKLSEFRSEACLAQKHAVYSVFWSRTFCKTKFFHAIFFPFRASESTLP